MKTNQTISILFWINLSRINDDLAPLYARISVNGKRVNLNLKERVPVKLWDDKEIKLKGSSPKAKQLNKYMDATRNEILQSYRDLISSGAQITVQAVKARYLGEDQQNPTLQQLLYCHREKYRDTQERYRTSQKVYPGISEKGI